MGAIVARQDNFHKTSLMGRLPCNQFCASVAIFIFREIMVYVLYYQFSNLGLL
ncbi:hypothetical protein SB521682_4594 [Shigella boydii 5216-82]|nr:hypothetical protein SB521682_4594 [Shigella boydii 5216-82]